MKKPKKKREREFALPYGTEQNRSKTELKRRHHDTAAIATPHVTELYGLNVMADGIQDDPSNVTRFVKLVREIIIPRTNHPFKTSIIFAHDKGTSVLFKVLFTFAFRNINLTKFSVDFEASMAEVRAVEKCEMKRVVGREKGKMLGGELERL